MSQRHDFSEHLASRPWLESFLGPCLTGLGWGADRIDRLTGFGRYARAQQKQIIDHGHLDAAQVDELILLFDACDQATGAEKIAAIDTVIARAVELTTSGKRLSESDAMRPRRRRTRQALEDATPDGRRCIDDRLTERAER